MTDVTDVPTPDAATFETHRPLLFGIAYRMLGSAADAEDVVQEAWMRWQKAAPEEVRSDRAYLSTVVTRLCLDALKSARAKRETYVGPWLPEPLATRPDSAEGADPESISLAFLVVLESLTPAERAVYLLHEVFDYPHAEIATMLGRTEAGCRQTLKRARAAVRARRPRFAPSREAHRRLVDAFGATCASGDVAAVTRLLAADATAWSDGGGKAFAARRPVVGADAVARFFVGVFGHAPADARLEVAEVNGWPALVARIAGRIVSVFTFETDGERIHAVRTVLNPDKLARLAATLG